MKGNCALHEPGGPLCRTLKYFPGLIDKIREARMVSPFDIHFVIMRSTAFFLTPEAREPAVDCR